MKPDEKTDQSSPALDEPKGKKSKRNKKPKTSDPRI